MSLYKFTMKLCMVVLSLANLCVAPFPEDHPYNWANPLIEPWWVKLEPEEQKKVYEQWQQIEPFMKAVAVWKERLVRTKDAYGDASATGSAAYLAGAKQLGNTLLGREEEEEGGKTRSKSVAQGKWEDFQASTQFASVQLFKAERAKYQALIEAAKIVKNKNDDLFFSDDESWLQQFQDNLKIESLQLKDQVEDLVSSGREGLIDSTEELWGKIQKKEAQIRDFLSNTKEEIRKKLWLNHVIQKRK